MVDGLYRVTTRYLCACFVVEQGKVTRCAPILRKRLDYYGSIAELIQREAARWRGGERD